MRAKRSPAMRFTLALGAVASLALAGAPAMASGSSAQGGAPAAPAAPATCPVSQAKLTAAAKRASAAVEPVLNWATADFANCRVVVDAHPDKLDKAMARLKGAGGFLPALEGKPLPATTATLIAVLVREPKPACLLVYPWSLLCHQWSWEQIVLAPDMTGNGRGEILVTGNSLLLRYGFLPGNKLTEHYFVSDDFANTVVYAPGDWDGDGINDIIAVRQGTGKMFLYSGLSDVARAKTPGSKAGTKRQIGQGWGGYTVIPAGDLTGDGIIDLLAIKQSTGDLYLYAGDGKGGFKYPYPKVGNGWKGYSLYAAGDINNDGKADILSIDGKGDLYFYAGKGNGTFAKKIKVGNGWGGYELSAGADLNGDGYADIVSRDDDGQVFFYAAKGGGQFAKRVLIAQHW
ncbi:MAG: VCBS repeat-containing protein [Micrococcales bacterium]|nr:VCBS repeat-containing protein [Micrococcales bacterium]